ncbi:hypothetical protein [Sulfuricurvum sp.]|uniref:hypothetical protein n=1 Tax=Sulfuricurvum sp. TaxID=2025608 RepID=UPI0035695E43
MTLRKIMPMLLILSSVLGLAFGSFSYTNQIRETKMGPIDFSMDTKERFDTPVLVGIVAIALGSLILL